MSTPPVSPSKPVSAQPRRSAPGSLQPCHSCKPAQAGSLFRRSRKDRSSSVTGRSRTSSSISDTLLSRRGRSVLVVRRQDADGDQHGVIKEVRHYGPGQAVVLLEGAGEEVADGNGEQETEPVVDVVAGAQGQAEQQGPPRCPAELLEPGQQIAADQGLLGNGRDRRYGQAVQDVVLR